VSSVLTDLLEVHRRRVRQHHLCRRQAPLHGVSGATRSHILCPQRHCARIHRLIQWRVTELYGRNGVGGSEDDAKIVYSRGFLTKWKCTDADSQAAWQGASGARRTHMMCPQHLCAVTRRLITWRVIELYGARWRRRRRRCRNASSGVSSVRLRIRGRASQEKLASVPATADATDRFYRAPRRAHYISHTL